MELPITASFLLGDAILLSWESTGDGSVYRVFIDGDLYDETINTELSVYVQPDQFSVVQVFDSPDDVPEFAAPGNALIGWNKADSAVSYRVLERVSDEWVDRSVIQDTGASFYIFRTRFLEDSTVHSFRVLSVSSSGIESLPLDLSVVMVRHPDVPVATVSYSAITHKATINV